MSQWKILAVDDEEEILSLIKTLLHNESCQVETAVNGDIAWEKLTQTAPPYDFVILDRRVPGIDGLQLLKMIKADERLQSLPVIIQSGANSPEQISEGIEAGAFYYLTKPYELMALRCIIRAVMAEIELRTEASAQTKRYLESLQYFTYAELRFSTLEDVNQVAGILAAMCPDPEKVSPGLMELLLNAVEHGNLGITYEEKKQLMYEDRWEEEVRRRLGQPGLGQRKATAIFTRREHELEFQIADQGEGFDCAKYLEIDPSRSLDPNGRGIAMARRYSFSSIKSEGTTVMATVSL